MKDADPITRRTVLKITGVAGVTTALAGCGGPGGEGNESGDEEENATTEETETGGDETETETESGDEEENATTEEDEADNESSEDGGSGEAIEPGTEIVLEGSTQAWTGVEPEDIADEENPTLTLTEGESYDITWENADGAQHNLVVWDDSDEIVDDYETDMVSEEGESATLEIDEVTDEMAQYVCEPHSSTMVGEIELESGDGGGGDEMDGNESDGNESDEMAGNESDELGGNESDDNESDDNESDDNESDL